MKPERDNHCSQGESTGRDSERAPLRVLLCVSVRDGGDGVRATVHQRRAGLHGRHAHADQTEGKRACVPSSLRSARRRGIFRELSRLDGNVSLPGEAVVALLNEPMSWDSEEPSSASVKRE